MYDVTKIILSILFPRIKIFIFDTNIKYENCGIRCGSLG